MSGRWAAGACARTASAAILGEILSAGDIALLSGLCLRTDRLELRLPDKDELGELAQVAMQGVHAPDRMPFLVPWTERVGLPPFCEEFVDYHLEQRHRWSVTDWHLELGVWTASALIGTQAINAESFAIARTVRTGSWLGQRFHGRGYGTEMRAAILDLSFDGLAAREARTGAFRDNPASAAVSLKLGYREIGERVVSVRAQPVHERIFALSREQWARHQHARADIHGLSECMALFGLRGDACIPRA